MNYYMTFKLPSRAAAFNKCKATTLKDAKAEARTEYKNRSGGKVVVGQDVGNAMPKVVWEEDNG